MGTDAGNNAETLRQPRRNSLCLEIKGARKSRGVLRNCDGKFRDRLLRAGLFIHENPG